MKNRGTCRKCRSHDIIRIDGKLEGGTAIFLGLVESVTLTRYICGNCGFTEEWVESEEDIDKLKRRYQSRFRNDLPEPARESEPNPSRWDKLKT